MPKEAFFGLPEESGIQESSLRNDLAQNSPSFVGGQRRTLPQPRLAHGTESISSALRLNAFATIIAIIINIIIAIIIAG
jgi:hypothetical protein